MKCGMKQNGEMLATVLLLNMLLGLSNQMASAEVLAINPPECGRAPMTARIVNGTLAEENQFPWLLSLEMQYNGFAISCGGSILTKFHILTVSHCTYTNASSPEAILAYYGSAVRHEDYVRKVEKFLRHPRFNSGTYANDVCLLKVAEPFPFGDTVRPICISVSPVDIRHKRVLIAGWGHTTYGGPQQTNLYFTSVIVLPDRKCEKAYGRYGFDRDIMFCAYRSKTDACEGDSGGPAVALAEDGRFLAVGLVSYGVGCANKSIPGVYTRLDAFVEWIIMNVGRHQRYTSLSLR